jgi:hypothetical protein
MALNFNVEEQANLGPSTIKGTRRNWFTLNLEVGD